MPIDSFPWLAAEAGEADARRLVMVRGLAAFAPLAERLSRPGSRIAWLSSLLEAQAPERIVRSTPYFWFYLREAFSALREGGPPEPLDRALDGLAVAAFDSLIGAPKGFPGEAFTLPDLSGKQLLRLGVAFPGKVAQATAKVGRSEVAVCLNETEIRLSVPDAGRAGAGFPMRSILDPAVDLGRSTQQIEHDQDAMAVLSGQLGSAFAWIESASPAVSRLIQEEIRFLVPLRRGKSAHYSFTLSQLPGLLFVGGSENWLPIVEAVVHETGHARLHHANEVHALVTRDAAGSCYSPWRNDPRPPSGVLHGLYVFRLVLDFWLEVLAERRAPLDDAGVSYVKERVALIYLQLHEAVAVLEKAELSTFGRNLLRTVAAGIAPRPALPVGESDVARARRQTDDKRTRALAELPGLLV